MYGNQILENHPISPSSKMRKLTDRQEKFVLNVFQGMSQREAYKKAGYSMRGSMEALDVNASRLSDNPKVLLRLQELRQASQDASVATVIERKQIATQGIRGELKDTEVIQHPDGTKTIRVRTASRAPYIAELNKMEKIYEEKPTQSIDNRQMNFIIMGDKGKNVKEMLQQVLHGRRELPGATTD